VPGNCVATVYVPATDAAKVLESGRPVTRAKMVKVLRQEGDLAVFEIGSGEYDFQSKITASSANTAH